MSFLVSITGKIAGYLPQEKGTSSRGTSWVKQGVILESSGQFPKKLVVSFWGEEKIAAALVVNGAYLPIGATVTFSCNIESNESNGRWFTNANGFAREGGAVAAPSAPAAPATPVAPSAPIPTAAPASTAQTYPATSGGAIWSTSRQCWYKVGTDGKPYECPAPVQEPDDLPF